MLTNGMGRKLKGKKGYDDIFENDIPKGCIRPYINIPRNLLDNDILI